MNMSICIILSLLLFVLILLNISNVDSIESYRRRVRRGASYPSQATPPHLSHARVKRTREKRRLY